MGRLIGTMSNRADALRDIFHQERAALLSFQGQSMQGAMPAEKNPYGWGLGFYQGGEVLHKKRPLATGEPFDAEALVADVRADCALLHVRQATVGDFRAENTHPFRMRHWLFAHTGTLDRFAAIREPLLASMPDFLRRNVRGDTDSECLFHTILSFLHDAGQIDNPDGDERVVLSAIRSAIALVERLGSEVGAKAPVANLVLTNGRRMFALRRGLPLVWVARTGLMDPAPNSALSRERDASSLRYVLIASDGPTGLPGYSAVPEGGILTVDRHLNAVVHAA